MGLFFKWTCRIGFMVPFGRRQADIFMIRSALPLYSASRSLRSSSRLLIASMVAAVGGANGKSILATLGIMR